MTRGDVRRAKLYYLRDLRGKAAKIKEKRDSVPRTGTAVLEEATSVEDTAPVDVVEETATAEDTSS